MSEQKEEKKNDESKPIKIRWVPWGCLREIAKVHTYEENQQQQVDLDKNFTALHRHLEASRNGEIFDAESNLYTLAHAAWHAINLLWNEMQQQKFMENIKRHRV